MSNMQKQYYVYIIMNKWSTTSYIGMTNNLNRRLYEHRNGLIEGFTKTYNIHKLVHYEIFENPIEAISREKQLKKWSRMKKVQLIAKLNPLLEDIYTDSK